MRIFLVLIVILNLLYAGWAFLSPSKEGVGVAPLAGDLKMLELLHEDEVVALQGAAAELNNSIASAVGVSESVVSAELKSADSKACYTLGPFKDESIMLQLRESIAEYVTNISVRKRQQSEKHRYWVHMPALADRKQAKLMAKKLRQKKVNDFYIVLSGEAKNGISLGHFRLPQHANRRVKRLTGLGFRAEINIIYRDYDIYWLDYQVDTVDGVADFSVEEYVSDGISQLIRDCKA